MTLVAVSRGPCICRRRLRGIGRFVSGVLAGALLCGIAAAQVTGISPDQLLQLQQQQQQLRGSGSAAVPPSVVSRETILEPTALSGPLPSSMLERVLSSRAGIRLQQFGYDQLGRGRPVSIPQVGAIQDGYVLGVGDEIVLTLRGQENSEYRVEVNRDGVATFPRLSPVSAAGRTFGEFRKDLLSMVQRAYVSTQGYVSVGKIRQINVLVSGEVGSPGVRTLTGLSTVMDAVLVSGGIKKSGSLRNIRIQRGGREFVADLYGTLIGGIHSKNVTLADGDKIIVAPIGATVAIGGEARRPGIYEIPAGRSSISVREAMSLANGAIVPGAYSVSLLRTAVDGRRLYVDVSSKSGDAVRDGDILMFRASVNVSVNQVTLTGAVRTPGTVALGKYKTLHDVLSSHDVLQPGAYVLFGYIDRVDAVSLQHKVIAFSPLNVIRGKSNVDLKSDDTVHILTKAGVLAVVARVSQTTMPSLGGDRRGQNDGKQKDGDQKDGNENDLLTSQSAALRPLQHSIQQSMVQSGQQSLSSSSAQSQLPQTSSQSVNRPGISSLSLPGISDQQSLSNSAQGAPNGPFGGNAASAPGQDGIPNTVMPNWAAPNSPNLPDAGRGLVEEDLGGITESDIVRFGKVLADYRAFISGGVREPGAYLVVAGTPVSDLLAVAGGLADDVDLHEFELTTTEIDNVQGTATTKRQVFPANDEQFASIALKPFDRLVFHRVYSDKFEGTVTIAGEVRYPGTIDILRTEKLSSVLRRAGGFTEVGYPEGAVFLRTSVAESERAESERLVADLRSQLLTHLTKALPSGSQAPGVSSETVVALEGLIQKVANMPALGRMPVVADLAMLAKHPEYDTVMEPGDVIVVPKRPATVLVMGDVLRPGAVRFNKSSSTDDYITSAGGTTRTADTSRVIVILPDGSVRSSDDSWLNFSFSSSIPAGSTIYVPRELEVYEFRQLLTDSIQVFSQVATTAAALAVLSKQ